VLPFAEHFSIFGGITQDNVPTHPNTGVPCPMGIDFGPDGDLFVCDNQGWGKANDKGRSHLILLIREQITSVYLRDKNAFACPQFVDSSPQYFGVNRIEVEHPEMVAHHQGDIQPAAQGDGFIECEIAYNVA